MCSFRHQLTSIAKIQGQLVRSSLPVKGLTIFEAATISELANYDISSGHRVSYDVRSVPTVSLNIVYAHFLYSSLILKIFPGVFSILSTSVDALIPSLRAYTLNR